MSKFSVLISKVCHWFHLILTAGIPQSKQVNYYLAPVLFNADRRVCCFQFFFFSIEKGSYSIPPIILKLAFLFNNISWISFLIRTYWFILLFKHLLDIPCVVICSPSHIPARGVCVVGWWAQALSTVPGLEEALGKGLLLKGECAWNL